MHRRDFLGRAVVMAALLSPAGRAFARMRQAGADVILAGGTVYDGTGGAPRLADVAISGNRIAAIGPELPATGATRIEVNGLAVAPGFIDIHGHTDLVLLVNPLAESKIRQGVTTEVVGQDGGSIGPWDDEAFDEVRRSYRERYDIEIDFRTLAGFFDRLGREPASVNLASMVGNGAVREAVIGEVDRPATPEELERMVALVAEALDAGACGLSSGLEYVPSAFSNLEELVALAAPLRGRGLPYASHMRNEDDQLLGAIEEAINVGRLAGVPVQVSHLKVQGERNWWKADVVFALLERAEEEGVDLAYDRYPYVAYSTGLTSLYPVWSRDGGTEAFLARLADPSQQGRIEQAVRDKVAELGTWDAVQITSTDSDDLAWARGRRLGELAAERGQEPYALLHELIVADEAGPGMVGFGMSEANTERILAHRLGMVCSDAGARAPYGPLSEGTPHPRAYGTFPRVLGYYARERGIMPLEDAVHKMTAMPASRLKLADRGVLQTGAFADVTVFDPATVIDQATFEEPHQYPKGIPHVIVNGQFVIRDGEHTEARPGVVVRPQN